MNYGEALNKAAAYCSQAERAPQDIVQKLQNWEVSDEDIERIIARLREEKFLSEERFVHAFINDKFTYDRWGRIKIAYTLRQKGIQGAIVQNTMDDVISDEAYLETLSELLRTKMRGMRLPLSQNDRAKIYRFAAQRGFESSVIGQALRQMNVPDEEL